MWFKTKWNAGFTWRSGLVASIRPGKKKTKHTLVPYNGALWKHVTSHLESLLCCTVRDEVRRADRVLESAAQVFMASGEGAHSDRLWHQLCSLCLSCLKYIVRRHKTRAGSSSFDLLCSQHSLSSCEKSPTALRWYHAVCTPAPRCQCTAQGHRLQTPPVCLSTLLPFLLFY